MNKCFSMLEVIISIAVAGILLAIVTNSFQITRLKKNQEAIVQSIMAYLDEQKANTQTGKDGSNYGIKFNASDFTLFKGTTYSPNSPNNKIIALDTQFQINETISNADNIIYFAKLIGSANEKATITISHISNRIEPQNIIIETSGTISVIE